MKKTKFAISFHDTDYLCIGGGIAGLMSAINAADQGMQCTIVEKANIRRSGSGGLGNDHFICYIPEYHGKYEDFIDDVLRLQNGDRLRQMGPEWARDFFFKTNDIVKMWEAWGIPMKHNGEYYFAGHSLPGRTRAFLKYGGRDQKLVLTEQARSRNVQIHNRRMGCDLLLNDAGEVVGALAISTREREICVYRAKAVFLGTGLVNNLWPFCRQGAVGATPDLLNLTADGRMMAWRAGAELCNLEMPALHTGIKYFSRNGQATWEGVLRDSQGKPLGPFLDAPNPLYGDITMEARKEFIQEANHSERGPIFMDMTGLTSDQLATMRHWLEQEGNYTLLRHLDQEETNLLDTAVEFSTYPMLMPPSSGIAFDRNSATCVPGLFAGGDEGYGGIAGAAVTGWWAADAAAKYAGSRDLPRDLGQEQAEELGCYLDGYLERKTGAHWSEALQALQNITSDYCGDIRSENGLRHGLEHLRRVHQRAQTGISAGNPHELAMTLGVLNLYELADLMFQMALERKESRGYHKRADFPLADLRLNSKKLYIRKTESGPRMTWR